MSKLCRKNNPLLIATGVFVAVEVVNILFNPTLPADTTLFLTAPFALVAGGATYVVIKTLACR